MNKYLLLYYDRDNMKLPKSLKDLDNFCAYAMYRVEKYKSYSMGPRKRVRILKTIGYFPDKRTIKKIHRKCHRWFRPTRFESNKISIKLFDRDDTILEFADDNAAKLYFEVMDKEPIH